MKSKLIIALTSAALIFVSGSFLGMRSFKEKSVTKNINVEVYKTASYISPAYSDAYATLRVSIVKVHGSKRDTAWQHDFAPTQLKDFPSSDKPLVQTITISNVNDNKEKLEILYQVTYSTKDSKLNFSEGTTIGKGVQNGNLNIKI